MAIIESGPVEESEAVRVSPAKLLAVSRIAAAWHGDIIKSDMDAGL